MSKIMGINFLRTVKIITTISILMSGAFLTAYFFHINKHPTGTLEQYELPFIEFSITLTYLIALLIGSIFLPLYYSVDFFSCPEIARVLFGKKAPQAIKILNMGSTIKTDTWLKCRIMATYMFFPVLYFIFFSMVAYIKKGAVAEMFGELTIILMCIGFLINPAQSLEKTSGKPWLIWLNLFCFIFMVGYLFFINSVLLYCFCRQSSFASHFHSDYIFLATILLSTLFISSFGIIKPFKHQDSIPYFRMIFAIFALLAIFIRFGLFNIITADNLKFIGLEHMQLKPFNSVQK